MVGFFSVFLVIPRCHPLSYYLNEKLHLLYYSFVVWNIVCMQLNKLCRKRAVGYVDINRKCGWNGVKRAHRDAAVQNKGRPAPLHCTGAALLRPRGKYSVDGSRQKGFCSGVRVNYVESLCSVARLSQQHHTIKNNRSTTTLQQTLQIGLETKQASREASCCLHSKRY